MAEVGLRIDGPMEATFSPLAVISPDTSKLAGFTASYTAAEVCFHERTFLEAPLPTGTPFRTRTGGGDDCHKRTDIELALAQGKPSDGWFGIFPSSSSRLTFASANLSPESRIASRLARTGFITF